jgi:phage-related protein (TIGR01555 family)
MDSAPSVKASFAGNTPVPTAQLLWYSSQTFIGYQMCAMLAQQWLISKACLMPAKDATRNGYEITVNDGTNVSPEVLDAMREANVRFNLNKNLIEFVQMGRVFGIRIAMFIIDVPDKHDFYKNPFNPDAITPGSYKGISQIDPYWITPQLDSQASGDPSAINFYEPTWWMINGNPVHRTHLIIFRTEEVSDILKPTYIFGGIPVPQKIAERVFAAERTANEAPQLALTKRMDVIKTDLAAATANQPQLAQRLNQQVELLNNYGVKLLDLDDEMMRFDTSLADLDALIMTQYQLVAAAANVPAVKLLGTSPKGFNASGEFEEANYHEELESIQTHDLTPLIQRHHLLLIRSEISPRFNIEPFETTIRWNELDAMTAKEQAELNRFKAETGAMLVNVGAIDGEDERQRIIADPHSGYTGLTDDTLEVLSDPE